MKLIVHMANERSYTGGCGLQQSWNQSRRRSHYIEVGLKRKRYGGTRQSCAALAPYWSAVMNEVGLGETTV